MIKSKSLNVILLITILTVLFIQPACKREILKESLIEDNQDQTLNKKISKWMDGQAALALNEPL